MALLETQTDFVSQPDTSNGSIIAECYAHDPTGTMRTVSSSRSLQSIRSLREIPLVNTSYDADFDTVLGERTVNRSLSPSVDASNSSIGSAGFRAALQSPIPQAGYTSSPIPSESPWLTRTSTRLRQSSPSDFDNSESLFSNARESLGDITAVRSQVSEKNSQLELMDEIAKSAGAIASMRDYLETWAPTAHFVVTAASALQRDASAFAASLTSLLSEDLSRDPANFANQFYQLREAYSSLLSLGDFSTVSYGQQGWTPAKSRGGSKRYDYGECSSSGLETTWDDRQLVDSLMTLLRTSPGFIASAISQMTISELKSFCGDVDNDRSPFSVLFHGIYGSAKRNRPRAFSEVLKSLDHLLNRDLCVKQEKLDLFMNAVLHRFVGLAIGNTSPNASAKLDRFFRICLDTRSSGIPEFAPILSSVLPDELIVFCQCVMQTQSLASTGVILQHLQSFVFNLVSNPHTFGVIEDVYISPQVKSYLQTIGDHIGQNLFEFVSKLRDGNPKLPYSAECWQPNELIAVKGSDIVLLYRSLLPKPSSGSRPTSALSADSQDTQGSVGTDGDEWCLDSIREDLVPVMEGLSHSVRTKVDGWQIFKVGDDGLVTDLGSDMGLNMSNGKEQLSPQVRALCYAIAHNDGDTVYDRVEQARNEAVLRGDFSTLLDLQDIEPVLTQSHVIEMAQGVDNAKVKCKSLRRMLDQAARDQRHERERLSNLLAILDCARVHIWYEAEARNSQAFYKSRQFLYSLYPKAREEDEDRYGAKTSTINGLTSLGFSFGLGYGSLGSGSINRTHNEDTFSKNGMDTSAPPVGRSRRLSILSSHSQPESPYYIKPLLRPGKLNDREVDSVRNFLRRNQARNILPAEERFTRGLVEIATLARKLMERDHLISYVSFKRDRQYQSQFAQQQAQAQARVNGSGFNHATGNKRSSHHHRRSSLGLFDFFDSGNSHQSSMPLSLHTTTSTHFLGLASSHDSLRTTTASTPNYQDDMSQRYEEKRVVGPPKAPSIIQVEALILSDIGFCFLHYGTETDHYMQQTGRMLLEGDSQESQPLLDAISLAGSPLMKLRAVEQLVRYMHTKRQRNQANTVSRSEIIQELSRIIGREPGTLYQDLQVISLLVNPQVLRESAAFDDCAQAARIVLDTVVLRSMDYASRFLRYYMESTTIATPKMALMGINDSVNIWAFCARQGHQEAQKKLAELYIKFSHLQLDLKPLVKPSMFDNLEGNSLREAVSSHWSTLASRI